VKLRWLLGSLITLLGLGIAPSARATFAWPVAASARPLRVQGEVWVNRSSGVYHCPGTRYYGATRRGQFMREAEARGAGYRPAYGRSCGFAGAERPMGSAPGSRGVRPRALLTATVWVNLGSHVYHCPGTRYYGATKRGVFMPEGEAQARGNRPAYGRQCS
jgi:hypothetical protein